LVGKKLNFLFVREKTMSNDSTEESCIYKELSDSYKGGKMSISPSGNFSIANLLKNESGLVHHEKKQTDIFDRSQKFLFPTVRNSFKGLLIHSDFPFKISNEAIESLKSNYDFLKVHFLIFIRVQF